MGDIQNGGRINCVFSTDNNYCQHLSVTLISLLENDESNRLSLHIVHSSVSEANLSALSLTIANFPGVQVAFYEFDGSAYSHFRLDLHITLASYFRLFLTNILPVEVTKLIYLDGDLVVLSDLQPLWNLDLENKLIAAAPDLFFPDNARLALPSDYCAFNAGVLVIDLAAWRAENLMQTFVEYVEMNNTTLRYHDQDTLNAVLHERVKYLDLTWNFQARLTSKDVEKIGLSREQFSILHQLPNIIHFTTQLKPWFYMDDVAFKERYIFYLRKTPWKNYVPPDRTAKNIVKKMVKRNFPWLVTAVRAIT